VKTPRDISTARAALRRRDTRVFGSYRALSCNTTGVACHGHGVAAAPFPRRPCRVGPPPRSRGAGEVDDAERERVERRLAALGEVAEDEFFAPTTRFDAVEIAVDRLAARMRAQGLGDVRFDRGDYE